MRDLRIVFMGTPDFAVTSLEKMVKHNYNIVGVITAPDKPAGRGRKLKGSAVKTFAKKNDLKIMQPTNLKDPSFIEELTALKANLQIVVAFRMLPEVVWQMPKYGTFNLHASLLPDYRGAAPINWAIMNGEKETGVTTFFIDEKIDTGAIILQEKTVIAEDDTAGTLHDKLMMQGADLVLKTVELIRENKVESKIQIITDDKPLRSANKIHREICRIDWDKPIDVIYNHIRGLSPYPAAWTNLINDGEIINLKIFGASKEFGKHEFKYGAILPGKKELKVAVQGGYLSLSEIQLPGKRRMTIADALNGLKLTKLAHLA